MEMDLDKTFSGGISWETIHINEDRLIQYFQNFGDVVEAVIMKDWTKGRARGFEFIVYADPSVAESHFNKYFDQFGTITGTIMMYYHNTERPRGFGFIIFDSEEGVEKVLYEIFHELLGKVVEVKRVVPKKLSPGQVEFS